MKVLVADDDITFRRLLERHLTKWGYTVFTAEDGNRAWEFLSSPTPPELAVIDWMMPGIDGPELCRRIRMRDFETAIYAIIVTAKETKEDTIAGLDAGADDYLVKPVDIGELRARINVGRRVIQLQRELARQQKLAGTVEMAGSVCHEMNQPLQVLSGTVELLMMETAPDSPLHDKLGTMKKETDRMGEITRELMSITYLPAVEASERNRNGRLGPNPDIPIVK